MQSGIHSIYGIKDKAGKEVVELQSLRFDKSKFTVAQAKKWLKDHDMRAIKFESATNVGKSNNLEGKQIKSFPFECKIDEEKGIFEGYASIFGNGEVDWQPIAGGAGLHGSGRKWGGGINIRGRNRQCCHNRDIHNTGNEICRFPSRPCWSYRMC